MNKPQTIFITGPKHCGKTSAGQALAKLYSCDFLDLDELITQRTGKTPRRLFNESPAVFQKAEAEAIKSIIPQGKPCTRRLTAAFRSKLRGMNLRFFTRSVMSVQALSRHSLRSSINSIANLSTAKLVLAAGGGIIDNAKALAQLKKENSVVVYLNISAAAAWQRIAACGALPPFLQTENPQETHRLLHERRAAAYSKVAGITINAEGKPPEQIAKEIKDVLHNYVNYENK